MQTGKTSQDVKTQKKQEIARAARELFTDFGYKSVSMDMIAQRANVAKGTLYLYFKDKEALFNDLTREVLEQMRQIVAACESKKLSLLDEIHQVLYSLLMLRKNQKFLFKVAQEAKELRTPPALRAMQMAEDVATGYLERRLRKAMEEKAIKSCDPAILTFVVIRVYNALAFEWEEGHPPLNEGQIAESVRIFLKDGVLANS